MSKTRSSFDIGTIIRDHKHKVIEAGHLNAHKKKVFTNLGNCRTSALGYHKDKCDNSECGHEQYSYNSCRDRHCPKCNGLKKERWLIDRESDLLPIKYFHVVFTVPEQLSLLFVEYPKDMYTILFKATWDTILIRILQPSTSLLRIINTWGQNLAFHLHMHCIVRVVV